MSLLLIAASLLAAKPSPNNWLVSIPASAGEPVQTQATVEYVSDGLRLLDCRTIVSSGDSDADDQACKTVTFSKANSPTVAVAPVWKIASFEGEFKSAVAVGSRETWLTLDDYPIKALNKDEEGTAVVRFDIDHTGVKSSCRIVASTGSKVLDKTIQKRVCERALFRPAQLNGRDVPSIILTAVKMYLGEPVVLPSPRS